MSNTTPDGGAAAAVIEELFPPIDPDAIESDAKVTRVTLLEDRALVTRVGKVRLAAGQTRLFVADVAPVLRDVSLRADLSGAASVVDARARRALRVRRSHRPDDVQQAEARIEDLVRKMADLVDDRGDAEHRASNLREMIEKAIAEIPEDASWGHVSDQAWRDTLEGWMTRVRELMSHSLDGFERQQDLHDELLRAIAERATMERPDQNVVAWLEIDVTSPEASEVELTIEYVVPNAIWRPIHSARLTTDGKLSFTSRAAVWQNTGEDWRDCELVFSTARSSLGTEPPVLSDDLLHAQRRSEQVVVQQREVAVQRASVKGGDAPAASGAVELPGVDDGGEVQNLRASGPMTIPSDGRPNLVPLFTFVSEAEHQRVCMPELSEVVFEKAITKNGGASPILAGPVELLRDTGVVGWTRILYVAAGERFELGFGPDAGMRVTRRSQVEGEVDAVSKWQIATTQVQLFVSNLSGVDKEFTLTERIPVSEIEHVKIDVLDAGTEPMPEIDDEGFCVWRITVPQNGRLRVKLGWRKSIAPGVQAA